MQLYRCTSAVSDRPPCWHAADALVPWGCRDLHAQATISGAKSAPLFQKTDWSKPSFVKILRAGALLANGVTPVRPHVLCEWPHSLADMLETYC